MAFERVDLSNYAIAVAPSRVSMDSFGNLRFNKRMMKQSGFMNEIDGTLLSTYGEFFYDSHKRKVKVVGSTAESKESFKFGLKYDDPEKTQVRCIDIPLKKMLLSFGMKPPDKGSVTLNFEIADYQAVIVELLKLERR